MILVRKCEVSQNRTASPERDDEGRVVNVSLHPTVSVNVDMEFDYDTSNKEEVALIKALFQALQDVKEAHSRILRSRKKKDYSAESPPLASDKKL